MAEKVLVAMSGGVDSTVSVRVLQEKGYEVAGATMKLLEDSDERVEKTAALAKRLGIDFFVFDLTDVFERDIIDEFAKSYAEGLTPNPCVRCNKLLKFGRLLDIARERGFSKIATGHYARIVADENGQMHLFRSADTAKDQSYFLFNLNNAIMRHVLFPLEGMKKEQVRAFAAELGLENAAQKDSQDICFVPDGNYMNVIDRYYEKHGLALQEGVFVDTEGRILGKNPGIERYTVGQRKGVGMALGGEKPLYVISKDPERHAVVMGDDSLLFSRTMTVGNVNFTSPDKKYTAEEFPGKLACRTRSCQKFLPVSIKYDGENNVILATFDTPVRAVTPGQFAVFYDGDEVVCGGEIISGE